MTDRTEMLRTVTANPPVAHAVALKIIVDLGSCLYRSNTLPGQWPFGFAPQPVKHEYGDGTCADETCCRQMTRPTPYWAIQQALHSAIWHYLQDLDAHYSDAELDHMAQRTLDLWAETLDPIETLLQRVIDERWINVYSIDRQYGGPEEGGWYYESGDKIESILCWDEETAQRMLDEKLEEYPLTRTRFSVNGGSDFVIRIEHAPAPLHYPTHAPVYC